MKARKLPSGRWRARAYLYTDENGKRVQKSFTADTKQEAEYQANLYLRQYKRNRVEMKKRSDDEITLREAYDKYIEARKSSMSPATIAGYRKMQRNGYLDLMDRKVCDITQEDIQKATDAMNVNRSPKTIRNYHGLLSAVIHSVRPDMSIRTHLKRVDRVDYHIPEEKEIHLLLDAVKDRPNLYYGILLAAFGSLRRSEICNLYASDIDFDKGIVHVRGAIVKDEDRQWVKKGTKTKDSARDVEMPKAVLDILPKEGKIVTFAPDTFTKAFINVTRKIFGEKRFRLHDLRHYQASILHALGVPDMYIMARGGWKTDHTLKKVYMHTMSSERQKFEDRICDYFDKTFGDDLKKE